MKISPSAALEENTKLFEQGNGFIEGITENGEEVSVEFPKLVETHKNKFVCLRVTPREEFFSFDYTEMKRVLAKDVRMYIDIRSALMCEYESKLFGLIEMCRDNVVLISYNPNKECFTRNEIIRAIRRKKLSCYFEYLDENKDVAIKKRLLHLIGLYKTDMRILDLRIRDLPIISSAMPEWERLKNLIVVEKGDTIRNAYFYAEKLEADPEWMQELLSSITGKFYFKVNNHAGMFNYILEKQEDSNLINIRIDFKYVSNSKMETITESIKEKISITELAEELVKVQNFGARTHTEVLFVSSDIDFLQYFLAPAVLKSLETSTNVINVRLGYSEYYNPTFFDGKEVKLSYLAPGRSILAIMDSRNSAKVKRLIESDQKGILNRTKLMVVGAGGAGKSSCCRALLGQAFVEEHLSTVVADGGRNLSLLDSKDINVSEAWQELPSQEENIFKRDFDIIIKNLSIENINANHEQMLKKNSKKKPKTEETQQKTTEEEESQEIKTEYKFKEQISRILRRKEEIQASYFDLNEIEKKLKGVKLTLWDFGGQAVFDAAHHFYLSNQGVVLLVFSLGNWINNRKEEEQNIKKWLASLVYYSPETKVFFVGTRAGATNPLAIKEASEALDKLHLPFDDVQVVENEVDDLFFFPVENSQPEKNKQMIGNLRESIKTVLNDPKAPWKQEVPLSWLFFMHLIDSEDKNITSLSELFAFAQEKGFSKEEVRQLLKFFTEAGCIVSFEERFSKLGNSTELVDDTVLKPKWLLKSLAGFLFDEIHNKNMKAYYKLGKGMKSKVFLLKNGFLSRDLWSKILKEDESPRKHREAQFLKKLCELMLVMSPVDQISTALREEVNKRYLKGDTFWLLPSMLNRESHLAVQNEVAFAGDQAIAVNWEAVTPQGLFERFVASFCKLAKGKEGLQLLSMSAKSALIELRAAKMELRKESLKQFIVSFSPGNQTVNVLVNEIIEEVLNQIKNLDLAVELDVKVLPSLALEKRTVESHVAKKTNKRLEWDFDCFLSHSWGNYPDYETHNQVLRIATKLKDEGFKVWVDEDELSATVADELHRGIDGSACFIAFVTKKYLKSADDRDNNAGKEFNYAAGRNGADSIIPVLLDPEFMNPRDWRGNVGMHLGNALYVDFTNAIAQEENMNKLCRRINNLTRRKRQKRKIDE